MELQTAKGVRDVYPEEQLLRQKVIAVLKKTFEKYGFSPLETPTIERFETLSAKYAGGSEILKETFQFEDQGKRKLGLRYDLTVPFCRFVGMNSTLKMPFKRYEMGKVFRDGPVSSDRVREFTQCDVDVVGARSILAEAEFISIYNEVFNELGIKFELRINNRKLLNGMTETVGASNAEEVILAIDKLDKIGEKGVSAELKQKGCNDKQIKQLFELINTTDLSKLKKLIKSEKGQEGIKELEELMEYTKGLNRVFVPSLARGLAYYTGTIFEVYASEGEIKSAIGAGGRYDKMIGAFLESKQEYPAVGVSFGLDRICSVLKEKGVKSRKTPTQIYVIPIKTVKESLEVVKELRSEGINAEMDLNERGISKNLDYANSYEIPFVLFIGQEELKKKKLKLRDMVSGNEEFLSVEEVVKKLK
ncbi:histidine--tRNA ligase [Candidatus Woesearchaeota archaeon]|nr:histidine--tRNA ligase [Candidatus Woesearchaeota archaeon]